MLRLSLFRTLAAAQKSALRSSSLPAARSSAASVASVRFCSAKTGEKSAESTAADSKDAKTEGADAEKDASKNAEPEKSEWQIKYEAKDKDAAKLKEAYQRAIADFRNLQKTTEQEVQRSKQFALQKFAKDLIESVDNFDLAVRSLPKEKVDTHPQEVQEFYNGITMVQQVLEKTLAKYGIVKVNPLNEKFDPNEHEALFQIPQEGTEPGTIIHVDRTGFKLHDRVLRAPKVGFVQDPENK